MAERFEVLGRDAELFARDVDDRPLFGGLGDSDIGEWLLMLGGGHGYRSNSYEDYELVIRWMSGSAGTK